MIILHAMWLKNEVYIRNNRIFSNFSDELYTLAATRTAYFHNKKRVNKKIYKKIEMYEFSCIKKIVIQEIRGGGYPSAKTSFSIGENGIVITCRFLRYKKTFNMTVDPGYFFDTIGILSPIFAWLYHIKNMVTSSQEYIL